MRRWFARFGLILAWIGSGLAALAAAADDASLSSLFDGKTLGGWSLEHTDHFLVRDGVIRADGGTGWLRSAKVYKNFELQAEYRVIKKGSDSGILFRASGASTAKEPFWPVKCFQLEIVDGESNLTLFGHGQPPPRFERRADALKKATKPTGEWQRIGLKVSGARAQVSLNGTLVTTGDALQEVEGYIGLQGENGVLEWRELKIRELAAK
jgi:hypothetical protein